MGSVVVDTDVVSYLLKSDSRAESYRKILDGRTLLLSFMTVAELYQWAYSRNWGRERILSMESVLRNYVIVPYNYRICQIWAKVMTQRRKAGSQISCNDAWVASTALLYSCPLITNNNNDFQGIDDLIVISA
ncbi:MAG TPA: type II toxin-antitoxin system VapC family toxin [Firmicutes bacterium]|nr:type II toxin-antitoxin system VapC family toxin [Bacillota bacterium]